jgi:hypothetical protein
MAKSDFSFIKVKVCKIVNTNISHYCIYDIFCGIYSWFIVELSMGWTIHTGFKSVDSMSNE